MLVKYFLLLKSRYSSFTHPLKCKTTIEILKKSSCLSPRIILTWIFFFYNNISNLCTNQSRRRRHHCHRLNSQLKSVDDSNVALEKANVLEP